MESAVYEEHWKKGNYIYGGIMIATALSTAFTSNHLIKIVLLFLVVFFGFYGMMYGGIHLSLKEIPECKKKGEAVKENGE